MIYTTYLAKLNKIPEESYKIIIARYLPRSFDINKYHKTYHCSELSPSAELLRKYKEKEIEWSEFERLYTEEITNNDEVMKIIENMIEVSERIGRDIYLICYEKDNNECHRSLLSKYIREQYKVKCEEVVL